MHLGKEIAELDVHGEPGQEACRAFDVHGENFAVVDVQGQKIFAARSTFASRIFASRLTGHPDNKA